MHNRISLIVVTAALLFMTGCSAMWSGGGYGVRGGVSSSLVDYLYPKGEIPPEHADSIPHLNLPLRVGVAFVPSGYASNPISEATKMELLQDVKEAFQEREYIEHIEVIPDTYLRSSNGITGMQQVARLYSADVMALVSYDQVSVTEDNKASILYWTIVGAYFIPGTDNEVQTFVDTAVFDVDTARLLFRAPGANKSADRSTAINRDEAVRKESATSFTAAMNDMTENLLQELEDFEVRIEDNPALAEVSWKPSHGGGGSMSFALLVALFLIFLSVQRKPLSVSEP